MPFCDVPERFLRGVEYILSNVLEFFERIIF